MAYPKTNMVAVKDI